MCNGLQLEIHPFSKSVWEAADVGAYWVCWVVAACGLFVDFVGDVELPKWQVAVLVEVVFYVVGFVCGDRFFVCF